MRRHPATDASILAHISGPGNPNIGGEASCKNAGGKSISTYANPPQVLMGVCVVCDVVRVIDLTSLTRSYPDIPAVKWQPICDVFELRQTQHRILFSVADGCGWGEPAKHAACCATDAFMRHLMLMHNELLDVREAVRLP